MISRKIYVFTLAILVIPLLVLSVSCDDTITGSEIDNIVVPDKNVSFAKHLYPIINVKCSQSCHSGDAAGGGYDMSSYGTIIQAGVVNPYSPETSRLIWRIDSEKYGYEPMPPYNSPYKPLTDNQRKGVYTWIKEGAKNN